MVKLWPEKTWERPKAELWLAPVELSNQYSMVHEPPLGGQPMFPRCTGRSASAATTSTQKLPGLLAPGVHET